MTLHQLHAAAAHPAAGPLPQCQRMSRTGLAPAAQLDSPPWGAGLAAGHAHAAHAAQQTLGLGYP